MCAIIGTTATAIPKYRIHETSAVVKQNKWGVRNIRNMSLREQIGAAGLHLWQVAYHLGMSDSSFSRKLRKELSEADREKVLQAIEELKQEVV